MHVRKSEVATGIAVRQSLVVDSHQMQNRCVQIVYMHAIRYGVHSELVGLAVHHATSNAAACKKHRKARVMMVSAGLLLFVLRVDLSVGRTTKLTTPNNERIVEHS